MSLPKGGNKVMRPAADPKVPSAYDLCQTPVYALDPLLLHLPKTWTIWEPCSGEGNLVRHFRRHGYFVRATDILDKTEEGEDKHDFLTWTPPFDYDVIVTNVPFSLKFKFFERAYELRKPFAFLCAGETLFAAKAQRLFDEYGVHIGLLNKRVDFKMPYKGYAGKGAHFGVAWFTRRLPVTDTLMYWTIDKKGTPHEWDGLPGTP